MNGYESSNIDEWKESLAIREYLHNEECVLEPHLILVFWHNPSQPQGSWSDFEENQEDQGAAQEDVLTPINALANPDLVEPLGAGKNDDLAPMPDLKEYAKISQRLSIEQEQDRLNKFLP